MDSLGLPEIVILFIIALISLLPLAAYVWALVALHRIRIGQEDLRRRLESIERLLQSARSS